jgi:repressor LexA
METYVDITDLCARCYEQERSGAVRGVEEADPDGNANSGDLVSITAGWPGEMAEGCVRLDPVAVLRATPRSFALRVRGQSMVNAGIYDGDIVVGEITPVACNGAIVVALIDGESTLKRLVVERGRPYLMSENPNSVAFMPLGELVVQGVVHTVVRRTQ